MIHLFVYEEDDRSVAVQHESGKATTKDAGRSTKRETGEEEKNGMRGNTLDERLLGSGSTIVQTSCCTVPAGRESERNENVDSCSTGPGREVGRKRGWRWSSFHTRQERWLKGGSDGRILSSSCASNGDQGEAGGR